jgi:hypothetical protein
MEVNMLRDDNDEALNYRDTLRKELKDMQIQ